MTGTDGTPDPNLRLRGLEGHGCVRQTGTGLACDDSLSRGVYSPSVSPPYPIDFVRTNTAGGWASFLHPAGPLAYTYPNVCKTHDLGSQPGRQPSRRAYAVSAEVVGLHH